MPEIDRSPLEVLLPSGGGSSLRSQIRHRLRHGNGLDRGGASGVFRRASADTVFDCAFAPPTPDGSRYLLGCSSSRGQAAMCVWDVDASAREAAASFSPTSVPPACESDEKDGGGKRRKRTPEARGDPVLRIQVVDEQGVPSSGSLYRLKFFEGRDGGRGSPMLAACGDGGVFLYKWSDLTAELERNSGDAADESAPTLRTVRPLPASVLRPHPSPCGLAEMNGVDYDPTSRVIYGASGDIFGGPCAWDVETGTLLGNLGSTLAPTSNNGGVSKRRNASRRGGGHNDYLHSVRVCVGGVGAHTVLTAGEDGKLGVWDGKERRLVELVDVRSSLEACPPGSTSYDGGYGGVSPSKLGLWVSSLDVSSSSSWVAVGGGVKSAGVSSITGKRSGSTGRAGVGGYVSLFSLPSRTPTSAYLTREAVYDLTYHPGLDDGSLLSVGNEAVLSQWNGADLSGGRTGRSWTGCTAGFGVVVDPYIEEDVDSAARVAVAGVGGSVDIFSHVGNRSFGLTFR